MISVEKCIFVVKVVKCKKLAFSNLAYKNNKHPKSDEMPLLTWEEQLYNAYILIIKVIANE